MSDFNGGFGARAIPAQADMSVDAGLRAFMLGVYTKLSLGLLVAAASAWVSAYYAPVAQLLYRTTADGRFAGITGLGMGVAFLPLVLILASNFLMRRPTDRSANLLYWAVVVSMGASLGFYLLIYTGASVVSSFVMTAAAFGALSLWGYTTKRDLGPVGAFLFMALFGIIMSFLLLAVTSIFIPSTGAVFANPGFNFILNLAFLLIFAGLAAYKTQMLKMAYYEAGGASANLGALTSFGALTLFITFVNLFLAILRLTGSRR